MAGHAGADVTFCITLTYYIPGSSEKKRKI